MEFEPSFFQGEEREGFYIAPMMKKAWAAQIEVLEDIKRVCRRHNIRFFADYGTLLGTIRHKGFIPWDDDMDIAMIRTDYQRFLQVAPKELPSEYCIINFHTEPEFDQMLTRVTNGRNINFSEEHMNKFHGCPYVVGIDIFIQDYMSPNPAENDMIRDLLCIVLGQASHVDTGEIPEKELDSYLNQIEMLCNVKLDRTKPLKRQLLILGERLCALFREEEATEITSMIKYSNNPNYHMDKSVYASSIDMPFENTTIPVPKGYETVLRLKYGEDYMSPKNIRAGHDYPFYKSQEEIVKNKYGYIPE